MQRPTSTKHIITLRLTNNSSVSSEIKDRHYLRQCQLSAETNDTLNTHFSGLSLYYITTHVQNELHNQGMSSVYITPTYYISDINFLVTVLQPHNIILQ